jgi:UDP-N-acetylmuramoylalanine--D-glutamate ligase
MLSLKDQHVLVLGLGDSGLAMARWCARNGARVTVLDSRAQPAHLAALLTQYPAVAFKSGAFEAAAIEGSDIRAVFKSPGLSPQSVAPLWQAAQAMGLWRGTELSLFAQALSDLQATAAYQPQVLAITGTNGKTTVTALTGLLLERTGISVAVAGNIGPTLLDTLSQWLDGDAGLPQAWVLELSSFQLEGVDNFEPTAAALLNITQDHLDWHGDMQAYAQAKANVFGQQALMLLNRDDAATLAMLPTPEQIKKKQRSARNFLCFGSDVPNRPGDYGLETVNGMTWLVRAMEADETRKRRRDEEEEIHLQRLMPADALRIRGRHNALNALAALALACSTGRQLAPMLYGLREYNGEPHRVEPVAMVHDVEYFDDSKGTNVGATVAALTGLGADRRLVVILGGDGKGQDFEPLVSPVKQHARAVVLIGRDAPALRESLAVTGVPLHDADSLPEAVSQASALAQPGDAVLLSPACASLDMFRNYAHRAEVFVEAVQALAQEEGVA